MIAFLGNVLVTIFGRNSVLATIVISMFPIIELKGAIPVGMSTDFWGENALSDHQAFICSLIGSCMVVPIIALIFQPIINYMKRTRFFKKFAAVIEEKVQNSSYKISTKCINSEYALIKKTVLKMLGVFSFVAIPLPFTGVWTGTCIAVSLGLKFWQVVVSCVVGNIIAAILVTFVCSLFPSFTSILFLIILLIFVVLLFVMLIKIAICKKTKKD